MQYLKSLFYFLLFIICWDIIHFVFNINSTIIPSFLEIFKSLFINFNSILSNTLTTLLETILGLILTLIFSFSIVIIIHENSILKNIFLKFIYIFQMIPIIAIAPIIIIWLGIGIITKIILIMLYSSFVIIITTLDTFENISTSHTTYIKSLTQNKFKLYKFLYFPLSYTQIFSSIKIAITYSIGCAITGEYLGAKSGLGVLLNRAYSSYQTSFVFAIIFVIILLTISLLKLCDIAEKNLRR